MTCIDDGKDGAMHGEYARNEPGVRKGAPEIKKAVGRTGIIVCFAARWREDAMRDAMQVAASREPPEDEHPSRPPSHPTGPVFPLPNSPSPGGPLSRAVIWTDDEWRPMKGGPGEADIPPGGHPQRNSLHLLNPCDATYMHTSQPIPSHLVPMSAEQTLPRTSTETRRSTSTFPPGSPRSAIPLPSPPPIPSCLQFHAIRCVTPPIPTSVVISPCPRGVLGGRNRTPAAGCSGDRGAGGFFPAGKRGRRRNEEKGFSKNGLRVVGTDVAKVVAAEAAAHGYHRTYVELNSEARQGAG